MPIARHWLGIARRLGLPATLIIIGILTIAGCIYIPVPEHPHTTQGTDAEKVLGAERSDKPLRPGSASRELVLEFLGTPDDRTDHDGAFAYNLNAIAGRRFGLCVYGDNDRPAMFSYPATDRVKYFLLLRFDRKGVLQRYQLTRASHPGDEDKWRDLFIELSNEDRVRG